jgi:hypothetical protein
MRKHILIEGTKSENSDRLFDVVRNNINAYLDEIELLFTRLSSDEVRRIVSTAAGQAVADRLYDDGFSRRDAEAFIVDRLDIAAQEHDDTEDDLDDRDDEDEEEEERRVD